MTRTLGEFGGTAALTAAIAGSNLMAVRLGADPATSLLIAAGATAAVLAAAIAAIQPISGAHFNPAVSVSEWLAGRLEVAQLPRYVGAQVLGGIGGVVIANAMFGVEVLERSTIDRAGGELLLSEGLATLGLAGLIAALVAIGRSGAVAASVGAYVFAIHFVTSSTGFANPAVSIGRVWAQDPAGIDPSSAFGFVLVQVVAGIAIGLVARRTG